MLFREAAAPHVLVLSMGQNELQTGLSQRGNVRTRHAGLALAKARAPVAQYHRARPESLAERMAQLVPILPAAQLSRGGLTSRTGPPACLERDGRRAKTTPWRAHRSRG